MSARSRLLLLALRLLALAVIGLGLAAPLLPEAMSWGVWPATYLSTTWRWGLALLSAVLVLFGGRITLPPLSLNSPWMRALIAAGAAIPFYLCRIVHTRWGDAYMLVNSIPHPDLHYTYTWQAPLDVFIHSRLWTLGNRLWGWTDAMPAYGMLSTLAGVLFIWVLLSAAVSLSRDRAGQALLIGLMLTLGLVELFFGYVENYSFIAVGVLLYLWLGLRSLRGEGRLWLPATTLALSHAFHPSTLILIPSLLYLAWATPLGAGKRTWRALAEVALPYVIIGGGLLAWMTAAGHGPAAFMGIEFPGGGDRRWFVPLFATVSQWEHYTMFSLAHLLDIVNQQLLVAPAIWPAIVMAAVTGWPVLAGRASGWNGWRDRSFRFLLLSALFYLLLIVTWNPDYGGQRDWDLFALAAIPATFLLAYMLPRILQPVGALRAATWALVAAQGYHTVAWIYQNMLPWSWAQMK